MALVISVMGIVFGGRGLASGYGSLERAVLWLGVISTIIFTIALSFFILCKVYRCKIVRTITPESETSV